MVNPKSSATRLEPFFFGSNDDRTFACFHPPAEPAHDCGVVICYPIWQEYIRSHRACLNLAKSLANAGFPSLRFDYSGSGDSAGDGTETNLDRWQDDINHAINELRERSGVSSISLVGLRFGASLAATVAAASGAIDSLVLWDPIINGNVYIEETIQQHQNVISFFFVQPSNALVDQRPSELLGFPISPKLLAGIEALDLLSSERKLAPDILVVESHTGAPAQQLAEQLKHVSRRVDYQHVPSFRIWTEHTDKGLVPSNVLATIVAWLSEVHA